MHSRPVGLATCLPSPTVASSANLLKPRRRHPDRARFRHVRAHPSRQAVEGTVLASRLPTPTPGPPPRLCLVCSRPSSAPLPASFLRARRSPGAPARCACLRQRLTIRRRTFRRRLVRPSHGARPSQTLSTVLDPSPSRPRTTPPSPSSYRRILLRVRTTAARHRPRRAATGGACTVRITTATRPAPPR